MENAVETSIRKCEEVKIYTLGRFLVARGSSVLSYEAARSRKVWDLFKFLLANRQKSVPPDEILEALWPEQEYADPGLAMRSLVFRLRNLLTESLGAPDIAENISFSHGCYRWEPKNNCWLDIEQFESLCLKAGAKGADEQNGAIEMYQAAIALYKGEFLPEGSYYEWTIPLRSYYHRLFVQSALKLASLLKSARRYPDIIKLCENVLMIEYYEEELHLFYLEALLEEGKENKALAHYEEVTAVFYREMGAKPSSALQSIYRLIKLKSKGSIDLDLSFVQEALRDRQGDRGPLICDPDTFQYLYKLERQRAERSGRTVFLGMVTITRPNFAVPPAQILKESMELLLRAFKTKLRKGDVVTRWNDAQYLIILPGLTAENAEMVLQRIDSSCKEEFTAQNLILHRKQQALLPLDQYISGNRQNSGVRSQESE